GPQPLPRLSPCGKACSCPDTMYKHSHAHRKNPNHSASGSPQATSSLASFSCTTHTSAAIPPSPRNTGLSPPPHGSNTPSPLPWATDNPCASDNSPPASSLPCIWGPFAPDTPRKPPLTLPLLATPTTPQCLPPASPGDRSTARST